MKIVLANLFYSKFSVVKKVHNVRVMFMYKNHNIVLDLH